MQGRLLDSRMRPQGVHDLLPALPLVHQRMSRLCHSIEGQTRLLQRNTAVKSPHVCLAAGV